MKWVIVKGRGHGQMFKWHLETGRQIEEQIGIAKKEGKVLVLRPFDKGKGFTLTREEEVKP